MRLKIPFLLVFSLFVLISRNAKNNTDNTKNTKKQENIVIPKNNQFDKETKTIHIIVALCDNKYQGIVPVPAGIGNGQNPRNNLYWGAGYGIKTFFRKSQEWIKLKETKVDSILLERAVFKHKNSEFYIVADAYNGKYIKQATIKFLKSSAGNTKDTINVKGKTLGIEGNSALVAYVGHDGLMDFNINKNFINKDGKKRDVIILACYSKHFFSPHLRETNINALVWTSGLMAPEAYTLHDALCGYVIGETNEQIRLRAAKAYSKYQKCSLNAAKNLLITE